jgi:hypothetical protein
MTNMHEYRPRDRYFVNYNGHKINLHLACQQANVPYQAAYRRLLSGMNPQEAFDALIRSTNEELMGDD